MIYKILAKEYFHEANILKFYIKKLKTTDILEKSDISKELNERIKILYGIYLELKHTGEYLIQKCEVLSYGK